jgi:hypothetical protein
MHWITFLEQVNKIIKGAFLTSSYQLASHQTIEKIKIFALEKKEQLKQGLKLTINNKTQTLVHNKFLDLSKVLIKVILRGYTSHTKLRHVHTFVICCNSQKNVGLNCWPTPQEHSLDLLKVQFSMVAIF